MGRNRKSYDEKIKKTVAIEALREKKTVAEIAAEHDISPSLVSKWKQELLDGVFEFGKKREKALEKENAKLKKERDAACLELGKTQLMLELSKKKLSSKG